MIISVFTAATALSKQTEELIVRMVISFGDWGYGLTFTAIQSIISEYLKESQQESVFKGGNPGRDWWYGFINRWKSLLSLRKADNIA